MTTFAGQEQARRSIMIRKQALFTLYFGQQRQQELGKVDDFVLLDLSYVGRVYYRNGKGV
jgi:hypothetical protein